MGTNRACCCSHINSHNQVRGHRTASSHSGAEEYPREKHNNPRWYTHISQLTQFMPPPETYKSGIGSHPTMCQVHTGAYVSLLAPGKTDYTACHPRKTTTYISHVVSTTTHTHNRRKSIGKKKRPQRRVRGDRDGYGHLHHGRVIVGKKSRLPRTHDSLHSKANDTERLFPDVACVYMKAYDTIIVF